MSFSAISVEKLCKSCEKVGWFCGEVCCNCGEVVDLLWKSCGEAVEFFVDFVEKSTESVDFLEISVDFWRDLVEKSVEKCVEN